MPVFNSLAEDEHEAEHICWNLRVSRLTMMNSAVRLFVTFTVIHWLMHTQYTTPSHFHR
ncbi:hypothetical protein BaRGS_00013960, partial [Batillaria attramentaria]